MANIMTEDRLTEDQRSLRDDIVKAILRGEPEMMMGGAAGSGKTTMLSVIADAAAGIASKRTDIQEEEAIVKIVAPTNRAAKILNSKLPPGYRATTLHYLLGARPQDLGVKDIAKFEAKIEKEDIDPEAKVAISNILDILRQIEKLEEEWKEDDGRNSAAITSRIRLLEDDLTSFSMGGGAVGAGDIIICDEASMVHEDLRAKTSATGAQIVWVGDPFQLEPVRGECWFQPESKRTLTKVMRQGKESGILKMATMIREGEGNARTLARATAKNDDVEFVFAADGMPIQWRNLAEEYGDKWLTWRNGFKTREHRFHTKTLNERYRYAKEYYSELPEPGERLYVLERFRNIDHRAFFVKGDEVTVDIVTTEPSDPGKLVLNECYGKRDGFEKIRAPKPPGITECICEMVQRESTTRPYYCDGRYGYEMSWPEFGHPWLTIAKTTEALWATVSYENNNGYIRSVPSTLLDPEYLLWDEEQADRLYRLDRDHKGVDGEPTLSPRAATLKTTFAYAGSVHQAQGGEWPNVCVFWDGWRAKPGARGKDNALKWLYTAVTRASAKLCVVVI